MRTTALIGLCMALWWAGCGAPQPPPASAPAASPELPTLAPPAAGTTLPDAPLYDLCRK